MPALSFEIERVSEPSGIMATSLLISHCAFRRFKSHADELQLPLSFGISRAANPFLYYSGHSTSAGTNAQRQGSRVTLSRSLSLQITSTSYHNSAQSSDTTIIAIRIDPQTMEVRLSCRNAVSSVAASKPA